MAVNGQMIGIDDYFKVSGEEMLQPGFRGGVDGKPKVSAGNTVNCRCVVQYRTI